MIKTNTELRAAQRRVADMSEQLKKTAKDLQKAGLSPENIERSQRDRYRELAQLQEDITWFELARDKKDLPPLDHLKNLGRLLIALRIKNGWSQLDLARALEVSAVQVSRDERTEFAGITLERADRILEALGSKVVFSSGQNIDSKRKVQNISSLEEPGHERKQVPPAPLKRILVVKVINKNPGAAPINQTKRCQEAIKPLLEGLEPRTIAQQDGIAQTTGVFAITFGQSQKLEPRLKELQLAATTEAAKFKCQCTCELDELDLAP